jgi:uncharacterized lipoprotein YddW (UPF0748 family)
MSAPSVRDVARTAPPTTPGGRRHGAGVLVLLLLVVSLGAGVGPQGAGTAHAGTVGLACPAALVPATAFTDTVGSAHRAAIDCASWWEVAQGRTSTVFAVGPDVTRGQAAAMIARLLHITGVDVGSVPSAGFVDTRGHLFEKEIDLLASLGIVLGISPTEFAPQRSLTRAQMASIIVRMFDRAYGVTLPAASSPFVDVSPTSVHADAIARLVGSGITVGTTPTTYSPAASVRRGQMASFVMRSTSQLVERGLATLPTTRPGPGDPFASRTRGAWVHLFDGTLKTRTSIRRMVAEMAAADVNLLNVQVARRHDAYYRSSVLTATVDPTLETGLDVLAEVVAAAHARGIAVHAWISVAPTWHAVYDTLPAPEGWLPIEHGITAPVAQRWVTRTVDGVWSTYLDPALPEVQSHVAAVAGELADRYAVDGIHLDYVRYESNRHGYHPRALERFAAETGITTVPAPTDPTWASWRRSQTRRVITGAQAAVASVAPDVKISAATISWGDGPRPADRSGFVTSRAYRDVLQDWDTWAMRRNVDAVMPMNYFRAHVPEQAEWFAQWLRYERWLAGQTPTRVVPGVAGYLNRPTAVLQQVTSAMHAADGALVYSVQQPTDDGSRGIWTTLSDARWGYPPARP